MPDFYQPRWAAFALVVSAAAGVAIYVVGGQQPVPAYTAAVVTFSLLVSIANFLRARPEGPRVTFTLDGPYVYASVVNKTGQPIFPDGRATLTLGRGNSLEAEQSKSSHPENPIPSGQQATYAWSIPAVRVALGDQRALAFVLATRSGDKIRRPVPGPIVHEIRTHGGR